MKRQRIRDMGPLERIEHAKQIRAEAKRRARRVLRRLSKPLALVDPPKEEKQ